MVSWGVREVAPRANWAGGIACGVVVSYGFSWFRTRRCAVNLALSHRPGWRNGRRTALKMRRGRPREGSNPSPGTKGLRTAKLSADPLKHAGHLLSRPHISCLVRTDPFLQAAQSGESWANTAKSLPRRQE